ncbi:DUF998 domain-containing protein [Streptosporangium sp. NPDC023615]|uniref:DUF998 domain-containing protein n=1 Tax=Streptosporangium sp. NPDC023615 TaxID=3154794 RepID=UPI003449D0E8
MRATKRLLACGAIAGPLFILVVLLQDYTRSGFDSRQHPLSLHALGDRGWIQVVNFVAIGVLNLAYAWGLRRALHPGPAGTWGPAMLGVYGLALIIAGIFRADPAFGFPPGVAAPSNPSMADLIHGVAAMVAFGCLTVACFVFARRFGARRAARGWAGYCVATGIAIILLFGTAAYDQHSLSLLLRAAVLLGWGWSAVIATQLIRALGHEHQH